MSARMYQYRCYKPGDINKPARIIESTSSLAARGIFAALYHGMHWSDVVAVRQRDEDDDGPTADEIDPWLT